MLTVVVEVGPMMMKQAIAAPARVVET